MSRNGRECVPNWGMKEEHQEGRQYGIWPRKAGEYVYNSESLPARYSPQLVGGINSEYYGIESTNKGEAKSSDVALAWGIDGSYSTKMSTDLLDWRQQNQSHSPRTGRDTYRSRSRSPPHVFTRELGFHGRSNAAQTCRNFASGRCRIGDRCPYLHQGGTQYKDRRCPDDGLTNTWKCSHAVDGTSKYSNLGKRTEYQENIGRSSDLCGDFVKGKGYEGTSCNFAHNDVASDKESGKEVFRERENESSKYAFVEHSKEHEPHRSGDMPCIFYAVGCCRNGNFCNFSHHGQTADTNDRSREDLRQQSSNLDSAEQTGEHLRQSATFVSDNANLLKWDENKNGNVSGQRDALYSRDDRWLCCSNNENRSFGHPTNKGKAVDFSAREYLQSKAGSTAGSGGSQNWFADLEISSPWNPGQSSSQVFKEDSGEITRTQSIALNVASLQPYEQDTTGEMFGQKPKIIAAKPPLISENAYFQSKPISRECAGSAFTQEVWNATGKCPMSSIGRVCSAKPLPEQSFCQNGNSSREYPWPTAETTAGSGGFESKVPESLLADMEVSSPWNPGQYFSPVVKEESGQIRQTTRTITPNVTSLHTYEQDITGGMLGQNNQPITAMPPLISESINKSGLSSQIPQTRNTVGREQLSQALSQLFGSVQQLSQLGAVPNVQKSMEFVSSSLSNSAGPVNSLPAESIRPNLRIGSERQYRPLTDTIESVQRHKDQPPPGFLSNLVEEKVVPGKPGVPPRGLLSSLTCGPSGTNQLKIGCSQVKLDHPSRHQLYQLNPVANCDGEGNKGMIVEESKKKKDEKVIRVSKFKFALVDFVKEILQPKWKDGKIDRDFYKVIAKKVSDKVIASIQWALIPQSQEQIDYYLASSKPKITKLVEAYVEIHQKTAL